jgi:hypothetical protein
MYFANMYCYGWDYRDVGITPIVGCMGVVYKGSRALYAIHIPDNTEVINAKGAAAFATFVRTQEKKGGDLFVFINGSNRPGAEAEAEDIKSLLEAKNATLYRIRKKLGPNSGGSNARAVSILVQGGAKAALLYKAVDSRAYVDGGMRQTGQYHPRPDYQGTKLPPDYLNPVGWHVVDNGSNSHIVKI